MAADRRAEQLDYFLAELSHLREAGGAFAQRYPQVAGSLGIGPDGAADPQIERLLEGFAFIAGRLQRNLDRQLPRLASALLDVLHPHMTAPTPSLAIAELTVDPRRARLAHGFTLPRGASLIATTDLGASVRLRTACALTLWALEVAAADRPDPALLPFLDGRTDASAVLRLRLRAVGEQSMRDALPDRLRLRVAGPMVTASALFETVMRGAREVWAQFPAQGDGAPPAPEERTPGPAIRLRPDALSAAGFEEDEALLPWPDHGHAGHRLVREYFALPEKFLFFDVNGLRAAAPAADGGWMDLIFVLDAPGRAPAGAERNAFRLGGVPVVNLFHRVSEPIRLDPARSEYRLQPDLRLERSTEAHSIARVTLTSAQDRDGVEVAPFFAFADAPKGLSAPGLHWTARRAPAARADIGGGDIWLAFRDRAFDPAPPPAQVAFAHLWCTSRGLAEQIEPGQRLALEVDAPVASAVCATRPTPQIEPPEPGVDLWRLVSHLSDDRLSFTEGPLAAASLREALRLHCADLTPAARAQIDGVVAVTARREAARVGHDAWRGWARGLGVALTLDETRFVGGSGYVFGSVMARYFGLYAGANAFVALTLRRTGRDGDWARFAPRAGGRILA